MGVRCESRDRILSGGRGCGIHLVCGSSPQRNPPPDTSRARTPRTMAKRTNGYTHRNKVRLVLLGPEYFDRLEALVDAARSTIHLQVYLLANDATGKRIGDALVRAAQRGVAVFLLVDGYASQDLDPALLKRLRAAGGNARFFEPLLRSQRFYVGRRLHHKVLVTDHRYALVTGRNIADRYTDTEAGPGWTDMAMEVEGEAALDLAALCCTIWNGVRTAERTKAVAATVPEREALLATMPPDAQCAVRVRFNDWLFGHAEISASYRTMLREARNDVVLMSSYFVPGDKFRKAMASAVRRGVRLRVITAGPSDVWIAKPAERWLHVWLLRRGIEVYEYQKNILHGKVGMRDGEWCTVGSFNLNNLSAYTTLEVNLDVDDAHVAGSLQRELDRMIAEDCIRITEQDIRKAGLLVKLGRWLAYRTLRAMHGLLTFYYRQQP